MIKTNLYNGGEVMRVIAAEEITRNVREMCIEANVNLSEDMEKAVRDSVESEDSPLGKQILGQLCENLDIAKENKLWQIIRLVRF